MTGLLWATITVADSAIHRMDKANQRGFGMAQDNNAKCLESLHFTVATYIDPFTSGLARGIGILS